MMAFVTKHLDYAESIGSRMHPQTIGNASSGAAAPVVVVKHRPPKTNNALAGQHAVVVLGLVHDE